MTRVLFYVQHLMGVGHVFRAMRIVKALTAAGIAVDMAYGGEPIPNFAANGARVHFLPPVRAVGEAFNKLEDASGNPLSDDYKDRRRDMLLGILEATRPDIVVTEAFPFGRRQMRFELLPLLAAARQMDPRPILLSSVRDILQETGRIDKDRETIGYLQSLFDHVLVHGDPGLVRLERTFPLAHEIGDKVLYTGMVVPDEPHGGAQDETYDVVVSVGGGALGRKLVMAAAAAKRHSVLRDARWCIVTGLRFSEEDRADLQAHLSGDVILRRFLPDLPSVLARARLSISRAGYNTVADICAAGCRAVVVPLSDGIETEQIRRAEILAEKGLAVTVSHERETPEHLAAAIGSAMDAPPPDRSRINLDGARNTARILADLTAGRSVERYR
ncbi:glycosyltransferase family protein [Mesorhizobium sp. L-8-3]|uniref:glycosyltransferase family protein n=1 Tax=Mesorhizobium sp. L-8-3 TaxID=2744522 RepID=UPI001929033C|nr:glycosyltransferase [Mesorhizobium sp. L-8-3]BCH21436.1 glycosyl transferase [Mesorhizobium sp. L-8-3]